MPSEAIAPSSLNELVEAVRGAPRVLAVGGGTKPRLSGGPVEAVRIRMARLSGVVEYEPSEFTFTALAGTTVAEMTRILAERGQYLPFDPFLAGAGATLGGTVAAGMSGPGRFRFGGVRDFILGIRFVDGTGRLLRMGGKVVKNAAGFDLPKFFVGSLGRWGVLGEVTFKVFPRPAASRTVALRVDGISDGVRLLRELAVNRWELAAVEIPCEADRVVVRLEGPLPALESMGREILGRWSGWVLDGPEAEGFWVGVRDFRWAHATGSVFKVPLELGGVGAFEQAARSLGDVRVHYGAGGQVAYVSVPAGAGEGDWDGMLRSQARCGLRWRGEGRLWCGLRQPAAVEAALKTALDPGGRFLSMEE